MIRGRDNRSNSSSWRKAAKNVPKSSSTNSTQTSKTGQFRPAQLSSALLCFAHKPCRDRNSPARAAPTTTTTRTHTNHQRRSPQPLPSGQLLELGQLSLCLAMTASSERKKESRILRAVSAHVSPRLPLANAPNAGGFLIQVCPQSRQQQQQQFERTSGRGKTTPKGP